MTVEILRRYVERTALARSTGPSFMTGAVSAPMSRSRPGCGDGRTFTPLTIAAITVSQWAAARCTATYPPRESPTTCALPPGTGVAITSVTRRAVSDIERHGRALLFPCPGRSGTRTRRSVAKASTCLLHIQPVVPTPCRRMTAGASSGPVSWTKIVMSACRPGRPGSFARTAAVAHVTARAGTFVNAVR
nr:hypothetical protein [Nonomuraea terrae]